MEQSALIPALKLSRPGHPLVTSLKEAVRVVRAHAIDTGELSSIRLVRMLKDAHTPDEIAEAGAAFRAWAVNHRLGTMDR